MDFTAVSVSLSNDYARVWRGMNFMVFKYLASHAKIFIPETAQAIGSCLFTEHKQNWRCGVRNEN
jgi:hypothetical protein